MVLSSVLASCDGSGIGVGAESIVSSAKTSTSTTGDKVPKVVISLDGRVFIVSWEMARCQRCLDPGNFVFLLLRCSEKRLYTYFSNATVSLL